MKGDGDLASTHFSMTETKIDLPSNLDTEEALTLIESAGNVDDPKIVEAHKYEALTEAVTTLEGMMADHLTDERGLNEDTVDAMSFEAMANEFRGEDGEFEPEALVQNPETENVDEEDTEALSEDADKAKAEALYNDYESMNRPPEGLEDDITEALGVSDFDEAKEVLD